MSTQYRQGDLLFIKRDGLPPASKKRESNVIQEGELTGHKHTLVGGNIFEDEAGNVWVHAPTPATVTHEEHGAIELEQGEYEVRRQRELDHQVAD